MNDIFDLLNIRNKFCKTPGRSAISKNSLPELKNKIDYFISYIQKLEFFDKTSKTNLPGSKKFVTNHLSVCTGFIGFIISLQNVYNLASYLLNNNYIEYFLSYKISQDHIEMFFSLIRRMNGFNNNPTSTQYLSTYKKLLSNKLNLVMSSSTNCTPQDGTLLLSTENHDMNIRNGDSIKNFSLIDISSANFDSSFCSNRKLISFVKNVDFCVQLDDNIFEHNYNKTGSWYCNDYAQEIIKYMAGFIVKTLKKIVHCTPCINLLTRNSNYYESTLITMKNHDKMVICF